MTTGAAVLLSLIAFSIGVAVAVGIGAGMFWLAEHIFNKWKI
jgi:ABC-type nickel/cobalt efflux system permease component RcnA